MPQDSNQSLREHLIALLKGGQAHATFEDAIKDLPPKLHGTKPENFPHSPWMLLEHLRIAQHDILEFSRAESTNPRSGPKVTGRRMMRRRAQTLGRKASTKSDPI